MEFLKRMFSRKPKPKRTSPRSAPKRTSGFEKRAAEEAVAQHPGQSVDSQTTHAYQRAYANCPDFPDFYDDGQIACIMAWVRIRNWVDYFRNRPTSGGLSSTGVLPDAPLRTLGIHFAEGSPNPVWPVRSSDHRGCQVNYLDVSGKLHGLPFQRFGAPRGSKDWPSNPARIHIGHDCVAQPGDLVVAPEAGRVARIRPFFSGTKAIYLWTDTGLTLTIGEIAKDSNEEFGIEEGSRVARGQPLARIGAFKEGEQHAYHMLHFETFHGRRRNTTNWYDGSPPPPSLRNPTMYLLRAACSLADQPGHSDGFSLTSETPTTHGGPTQVSASRRMQPGTEHRIMRLTHRNSRH